MANFNKVFLMGNLTRDPELRYTPSGTAVASMGLAVNRKWRSKDGQDKEETTFVDLSAFGRQAEVMSEYLSKGRPVFIEGRLKLDQWQDKSTGANRSKLTVTVENFQFLGSRGDQSAPRRQSPPGGGKPSGGNQAPLTDDDIPF